MGEEYEIFVSHSHADTSIVRELVDRWQKWKHRVYADFNDQRLLEASQQGTMSVELADLLRKRILDCRMFVFIASENSATSDWMPWELGLAHGAVGRVHLYMLDPTAEDAFSQREYLELYRATTFDAKSAKTYLAREMERARAEPANPAQRSRARDMGKKAGRAILKGRTGDASKESIASPFIQGGETSMGASEVTLEDSFRTLDDEALQGLFEMVANTGLKTLKNSGRVSSEQLESLARLLEHMKAT